MTTVRNTKLGLVLALLLALAMVAAACGNDDDSDTSADATEEATEAPTEEATEAPTEEATEAPTEEATEAPTEEATEAPADDGEGEMADGEAMAGQAPGTEGCADGGYVDPADISAERPIARCEEGYPEPQPLEERETVTMSTSFRAEFVAPILLGVEFGEFEKENIDVEIIELGFSDALPSLATCDIDFAIGGTEAALHNAINNGLDVRWVVGNFFPPDAGDNSVPQTGLWARSDAFTDPENPDLTELEGTTFASAVGLGSIIVYPIGQAFAEQGVSLLDLDVEQVPSPDMPIALENNAVQSAWMLDPYWSELADNPDYVLVASQPPGEPLGGLYAGPCVRTGEDREKGEAFIRAMIRTINTYLPPDYQNDPEVVAGLVNQTGTPEESILGTKELYFDWEIREGTSERAQEFFIEYDTVEYDEPLPEDMVVDRSLYMAAVGAQGS